MSEYATESPVSLRKRRQRRRALITIGTILLGLFFAFWYALSYFETDTGATPAAASPTACRTVEGPAPQDVKVWVLNATNRVGLAGRTATEFQKYGFQLYGKPANDTSKRKTPTVAELRFGKGGSDAAATVMRYMPDGTKTYTDGRKGATVTVVLGTDFSGLVDPGSAADASLPVCPSPSASASQSGSSSPSPSGS